MFCGVSISWFQNPSKTGNLISSKPAIGTFVYSFRVAMIGSPLTTLVLLKVSFRNTSLEETSPEVFLEACAFPLCTPWLVWLPPWDESPFTTSMEISFVVYTFPPTVADAGEIFITPSPEGLTMNV